MDRGSRKHVLDWTDRPSFLLEFRELLGNLPIEFGPETLWMPRGRAAPNEARLEKFGPAWIPEHPAWEALIDWWLVHRPKANTPNWDIAVGCRIEDRPGLVLAEAKANGAELKPDGKPLKDKPTQNSKDNDTRIRGAVAEASEGWRQLDKRVHLSADTHYQLANRLAFIWKLATLEFPVVLVYLGFTGDEGIRDVGEPFLDAGAWDKAFKEHLRGAFPEELIGRRLDFERAPCWVLSRARAVLSQSLPRTVKRIG